ncbi:chromate transporter [Caloranaerobacter azorensis DSM 13643]|uniref:Chromate transporter n=1 Tax=Caloranaerobacter azorensis DSM 13643 TaxID=1121264 RepID=A0A1M5SJ35_9FIRM|nr:chromate transporter [Caloranaerobacter azorensis]SHH38602.1 chromate transporter [Caloranaerobacter azorensis DSM 13643]
MSIIKLFLTFFKIGAFTFGGGYAMIPLIQVEVVDKNKWIDNEEFLDIIAIAQSSPGAIAVNSAIFIGYKIGGIIGALACMLGVILPSFIIILIISMFLFKYRNNEVVSKIFLGVRPAVVALIISAVYKLTKTSRIKKKLLIISLITLILVVFVNISPVVMVLVGGFGAIVYFGYKS